MSQTQCKEEANRKRQKGYYLPDPLILAVEHLATNERRPSCKLVEEALSDYLRAKTTLAPSHS
jgi:hypothetical protein